MLNYGLEIKMKRNQKFWGIKCSRELREVHGKTIRVMNEISSEIRKLIVSGKIVDILGKKLKVSPDYMQSLFPVVSDNMDVAKRRRDNLITDAEIKDIMSPVFDRAGCVSGVENYRRSVVMHVVERYAGYMKRNYRKGRKKIPNVRIHDNKSLYFQDNSVRVDVKKRTLTLTTLFGPLVVGYAKRFKEPSERTFLRVGENRIRVDVEHVVDEMLAVVGDEVLKVREVCGDEVILSADVPESGVVKFERHTFGGNLTYHSRSDSYCMVGAVDCSVAPLYVPLGALGFDMNKTGAYWLSFSDNFVIKLPKKVEKMFKSIKRINEHLNLKNRPIAERFYIHPETGEKVYVKSKVRRNLRLLWKQKHKLVDEFCLSVARRVVNRANRKKLLLCVDSVKGGQDLGTFGQDHFVPAVVRMCENEGVPFYVVPCQYTSQTCSCCGFRDPKNRSGDDFKCLKCGHKQVSHFNAAVNIENWGWQYFQQKRPYGII